MNKKYVIFDMDGTLIDSMGVWKNLGKEYLESKGITDVLEEIWDQVRTMTMTESAKLFVDNFGLKESPERVVKEMNGMMERHYRSDIPLKRGILVYLEALRQNGVRMCVASATEESLIKACLQRLGILSYFDFTLSCESIGISKRDPAIYKEAAKKFAVECSEIAVFEDSLYALITAKEAGFYVVGVYDTEVQYQWKELCSLADETINFN